MTRRIQPSRHILENLLDCEGAPNNDSKNVRPPSRDGTRPPSEHSSGQVGKGTATHDLDSSHSRSLSGFSFVPGDDAFITSTGDRYSSEATQTTVLGKDGGSGTEPWQYEKRVSQHAEDNYAKSWDSRSSASSVDTVIFTDRGMAVSTTHHGSLTAKGTGMPLLHGRNEMQETNSKRVTSGDGTRDNALGGRREAREDDTSK